jgi:aspartyl-tRNA(Asn)/glutamyl-tRNA(Gln) amidotransferase subunit B
MYEPVIGVEVHVRLATVSKLFCSCAARATVANSATCPICLGHPGALPLLNKQAVHLAVRAALALGCQLNARSVLARKSYFYPDLPKGYQISQYTEPIAGRGLFAGIALERLHLEDDAGKLVHRTASGRIGRGDSLVDFNRSGAPLIEIVTAPAFSDPQAVSDWLRWLRLTLISVGVTDGEMEHGSLRCDANVSLRAVGDSDYGTKTELKNLNSFRFIERGISAEIARQQQILELGQLVRQATIHYDPLNDQTRVLREKEAAADYRYVVDPDFAPIIVDNQLIAAEQAQISELPYQRYQRFGALGIPEPIARLLVERPELGAVFEREHQRSQARTLAQWLTGEVLALTDNPATLPVGALDTLVAAVDAGVIAVGAARTVLMSVVNDGGDIEQLLAASATVTDEQLDCWIDQAIAADPSAVQSVAEGHTQALGPIIGAVMRQAGGRVDGGIIRQRVRERLNSSI